MKLSLSRLRPLHLAIVTVAYWIGLAVVKLGTAIALAWQVTRLPPGHGSLSAGLTNFWRLTLTIARDSVTLWAGATTLGEIVAWVAGPPLLLALTWRWTRQMEAEADQIAAVAEVEPADNAASALPEGSWLATRRSEQPEARPRADIRRPE